MVDIFPLPRTHIVLQKAPQPTAIAFNVDRASTSTNGMQILPQRTIKIEEPSLSIRLVPSSTVTASTNQVQRAAPAQPPPLVKVEQVPALTLQPNAAHSLLPLHPHQQQQQQQQPNMLFLMKQNTAGASAPSIAEDGASAAPLDLSCPKSKQQDQNNIFKEENQGFNGLPPPIHPRTSSCSSTSSSGSSNLTDEEKRQKRKEQNKAAAQSYRQRKKSFSGMIETEHELLTKRNLQLKAQKQRLEDQIQRMRDLLNDVIEESKRDTNSDTMSEPIRSPAVMSNFGGSDIGSGNEQDVGFTMRSRKNTWPSASGLIGKDRKKEQNKLASRRFRQRRKQEQSNCEREAAILETTNRKLHEKCEELESKIKLLKDLMNQTNATSSSMCTDAASAVSSTIATKESDDAVTTTEMI